MLVRAEERRWASAGVKEGLAWIDGPGKDNADRWEEAVGVGERDGMGEDEWVAQGAVAAAGASAAGGGFCQK